jgi:hypothetical protein
MKNIIFCRAIPCSVVEGYRCFSLQLACEAYCYILKFSEMCSPEKLVNFARLHSIAFQKAIVLSNNQVLPQLLLGSKNILAICLHFKENRI